MCLEIILVGERFKQCENGERSQSRGLNIYSHSCYSCVECYPSRGFGGAGKAHVAVVHVQPFMHPDVHTHPYLSASRVFESRFLWYFCNGVGVFERGLLDSLCLAG